MRTDMREEVVLTVTKIRRNPDLVVVEYPADKAPGQLFFAEDNVKKRLVVANCRVCDSLHILGEMVRTYNPVPS